MKRTLFRPSSWTVYALMLSAAWGAELQQPAAPAKRPSDPVAEIAAQLEPSRKVVYKRVGSRPLMLHVFEPAGLKPTDRRPCFLVIHGGGWTGGEPRRMYPYADHFARRGWVGISLEYRLLNVRQGTTVFDCVKDGRSSVRFLRSHAAELGIDPEKIVVSGASAGGHVAAGTALFTGVDEPGESNDVACSPIALILLYPVIDTSQDGYGHAKIGDRWQELSPVHQVQRGVPPTLIFHGTGDTVTPYAGAVAFRDAMRRAGNRCELESFDGGKHGYLLYDRELFLDTLHKTDAFLASLGLPARD